MGNLLHTLSKSLSKCVESVDARELVHHAGVQCYEDARTSHPCERGAGLLR